MLKKSVLKCDEIVIEFRASTMSSSGSGMTKRQEVNASNNAITADATYQKRLSSEVKAVGGTEAERNLTIQQGFDKGVSVVNKALKGNKKLAYIFGSLLGST
jgi:hypothetical protein